MSYLFFKKILPLIFAFSLVSCSQHCISQLDVNPPNLDSSSTFISPSKGEDTLSEDPLYYYREHLESKIFTLKKIDEQNAINYRFAFLTDLHWISNMKNSPSLLNEINKEYPMNKVVLGGDYVDKDYDDVNIPKSIMKDCASIFSPFNYVGIVGNHDSNKNAVGNTERIPDTDIFNLINNSDHDRPYLFEFNEQIKLCSLYLNSSTGNFDDAEQKSDILKTLLTLDNSWYVVIFIHIIFDGTYSNNNESMIKPAGIEFFSFFSSIIDSVSCNFVGVFSGHSHLDHLDSGSYCFPVVTTMCDAIGVYNHDYNIYLRKKDTYTEQAFDIVQIDFSNRKVFLTRIGAGSDRSYYF